MKTRELIRIKLSNRQILLLVSALSLLAVGACKAIRVPGWIGLSVLINLIFLVACGLLVPVILIGVRLGAVQRDLASERFSREEAVAGFRSFVGPSPTVAYLKDSAGRLLFVNNAYSKVFDTPIEQLAGRLQSEILPPAIVQQLLAHDRSVLNSKCAFQFDEIIPGKAGELRHWLSFKFPVSGHHGEVFLGGVSVEITEMVRAQDALRESEARYRQLIESAGDIIVRCDASGRITYINEPGERILKFPADQLLRKRALRFVSREARRRARSTMWKALTGDDSDLYVEVPVVTGDGTELWLGQNIRVLREGASIKGFQAICRDISGQRKMEADLRASEERFRLLYENGPVAYHEIDRDGVIRRVNRAECELLGYSESELIGRSVLDLMVAEVRAEAQTAMRAKIDQDLPLRPFSRVYLRRDGRRLRLEIHEKRLRDNDGLIIGLHSVLLDVTQRHLAEMLDRDRWKVSEMMAQQQPLDHILLTIGAMISHQDETLSPIPVQFKEQRLEPICSHVAFEQLCQEIRDLGKQSVSLWPLEEFRVTHHAVVELSEGDRYRDLATAASRLGLQSCWSLPILSSEQKPLGMLLVFSQHTAEPTLQEQKMMEAASRISALAIEHRYLTDLLAFQASHDCLTRLPNRSSFEAKVQDAIVEARERCEQLALFYVDLDRFKDVNDTFGHSGGDELLRQVASRLRRCIRHTDTLSRIGGDEFAVLLTGLRDNSEAKVLAEIILRAFHVPFEIAGWQIHVTPSIGISFYPDDGVDAPTLQRNSDTAMYLVKNAGKNNFRCYASDDRACAGLVGSAGRA